MDGVDLEVPRGSFFGFLGPNGAGKSTTIRMLTGLIPADSGEIEILGYKLPAQELEIKKRIGLVQDLQRYNAAKQYSTLLPGGAASLNLAWPIVRNRGVYRVGLHWPLNHFEWLDETKAPLKKA